MILDGVTTTPTSSFPYTSVGPIDFSNLNFVRTTQVDYYYGDVPGVTGTVLLSTVTQTYDPSITIAIIGLLFFGFLIFLWKLIKKLRK